MSNGKMQAARTDDLYKRFFNAYKQSFRDRKSDNVQKEATSEWNEAKERYGVGTQEFVDFIKKRIDDYDAQVIKRKISVLSYFTKKESQESTISSEKATVFVEQKADVIFDNNKTISTKQNTSASCTENKTVLTENDENFAASTNILYKRRYPTPAQDETAKKVKILENKLNVQLLARNANLGGNTSWNDIKKTKTELDSAQKQLNEKEKNAFYQQKFRVNRKQQLQEICTSNESVAAVLKVRENPGHPRIEKEQPGLLETIKDIATFGSAAHDRRRTEEIRTCKTLDELHKKLLEEGLKLSRSATYLRLLPRNSNTIEGKRHVTTAPVKLCKAQNDEHKFHADSNFCIASIRAVEKLASILGHQQVAFISQDDKARVPIGITAATKQSCVLMHVEYRVKLPDHDWVVAAKHKLIPSVYGGIELVPGKFGDPSSVSYSDATMISIRSGKHDSSTAASHSDDFERLMELPEFDSTMKHNGEVKPIVILSCNGGPDENPRYCKVISYAIQHFKKYNLDGIYVFTNAPGRSAFNRVERRMAPLSSQLSGLVLKHDVSGSHLDKQGKTVDEELELKNFEAAGNLLANIWNEMVIDNYPVVAEFVKPVDNPKKLEETSHDWQVKHVRESQYLLQITKCNDVECCGPLRSDLHSYLPNGFLPPPCPIVRNKETGRLEVPDVVTEDAHFLSLSDRINMDKFIMSNMKTELVYDHFCPSVQSQLEGRTCATCGMYFASKKKIHEHKKNLKHRVSSSASKKIKPVRIEAQRDKEFLFILKDAKTSGEDAEWIEEEYLDEIDESIKKYENIEVSEDLAHIVKVKDLLQLPFTNDIDL